MMKDQKLRDKVALVATLLLVPVFLIVLFSTIKQMRSRGKSGPKPAAAGNGAQLPPPPVFVPGSAEEEGLQEPGVPEDILEEQRKIAALTPAKDPFAVPRGDGSTSPSTVQPQHAQTRNLSVSGIMLRQGKQVAIIDGDVLGEGDRVGEWVILSITGESVVFNNGREQKTVYMGK